MKKEYPDYTIHNVKYLRANVELTIEEMSNIVGIDPIDLFLLEEGKLNLERLEYLKVLVFICDYFTIALEDLVLKNLQAENRIEQGLFESLKRELNGEDHSRSNFKKPYLLENPPISLEEFEAALQEFNDLTAAKEQEKKTVMPAIEESIEERIEVMAMTLRLIHKTHIMQDRYTFLRKQGRIDKIDFWESSIDD